MPSFDKASKTSRKKWLYFIFILRFSNKVIRIITRTIAGLGTELRDAAPTAA